MVRSTLRENRAASTAQNARFTESGTATAPAISPAQKQYDEACWTAVRPVSGTPLWACPAPGGGRAAIPPWEPWPDTPRDPARFAAKLANGRKPAPAQAVREVAAAKLQAPQGLTRQKSHAWRIAFDEPAKAAVTVQTAEPMRPVGEAQTAKRVNSTESFAALRKRIALVFGFAYLLLLALASGLSIYMPLNADDRRAGENPEGQRDPGKGVAHPTLHGSPSQTDYRPRPHHPHPDPHAAGLHIRPDGSRYLIVPLNFAGAAA